MQNTAIFKKKYQEFLHAKGPHFLARLEEVQEELLYYHRR